jgi:phosphoglycerol transferase
LAGKSALHDPRWFYSVVVGAILLSWALYYGRIPGSSRFEIPVAYQQGNGVLGVLATIKAFAQLPAPWNLEVEQLSISPQANFTFSVAEKLVFYVAGGLARILGLGSAANASLLLAQITAGVAFAWVARQQAGRPALALLFSLIFALSPYLMGSGLAGLTNTFVWHVPLLVYLVGWLGSADGAPSRRARVLTGLLLLATSLQSPYYAVIAWQLLAFAVVRSWQHGRLAMARWGLVLLVIGIGAMFITLRSGAGPAAPARSLAPMVASGLRLPDLFLPVSHPVSAWAEFARKHYFQAENAPTENTVAFLGVIGCCSVLSLLVVGLANGLKKRWAAVPWEAWVVVYVLVFALVGLNYLLGSLGITAFYASHRYGIVILCIALLWASRAVDALTKPTLTRWSIPVLFAVAGFEFFGMRPRDFDQTAARAAAMVRADQEFVQIVEGRLPAAARLLVLPQVEFPAGAPLEKVAGDDALRPFLWSDTLRFSIGTQRGSAEEPWQRGLSQAPAPHVLRMLREQRFQGVLIHRPAYKDGAHALDVGLSAEVARIADSRTQDFTGFDLTPSKSGATRRRLAFRFFPQGDSEEPFAAAKGQLVGGEESVASVRRSSPGTYTVTLRYSVKRVLSIQLTAQNVKETNSFVKLFDVLYEGSSSLFAFRINNVEAGALADMAPSPHNSIMVTMEVEAQ